MPLYSIIVNIDNFLKLIKGHIPNVIFSVHQESAKDIDSKNSEALTGFNSHDCASTFGKD
jgi:hypothetical protein